MPARGRPTKLALLRTAVPRRPCFLHLTMLISSVVVVQVGWDDASGSCNNQFKCRVHRVGNTTAGNVTGQVSHKEVLPAFQLREWAS